MQTDKLAMLPDCIILYGPTAVGKTDLADILGLSLPIEIINADVGQLYTPLTIGTAKPDWKNHQYTHHLFDIIDEPIDYTAYKYIQQVKHHIKEIKARGAVPIIVGGSGFYIRSLFFSLSSPPAFSDETNILHNFSSLTTQELWQQLHALDSIRAQAIMGTDRYRIERALIIARTTGTLPSAHYPIYCPVAQRILLILLERDAEDIRERISTRVATMIKQGWLHEVEQLRTTAWEQFLLKKKLIGYNELLEMEQKTDLMQVQQLIAQRTKQYAKKQTGFLRMLERKIAEAQKETAVYTTTIMRQNLTHSSAQECIQNILKQIAPDHNKDKI